MKVHMILNRGLRPMSEVAETSPDQHEHIPRSPLMSPIPLFSQLNNERCWKKSAPFIMSSYSLENIVLHFFKYHLL